MKNHQSKLLNGKELATNLLADLKLRVGNLQSKNVTPHLVIILVGNDPASAAYVRQKELKAGEIGALTTVLHKEEKISEAELLATIQQLNNDNNVHGVIAQRPLPVHINHDTIAKAVNPNKDVDGLHPDSPFPMPLAEAVLKLLEQTGSDWKEKKIAVIGKGDTGGGPVISALKKFGVEPRVIDSKTVNPDAITQTANIVVSAVGKTRVVRPEMLKKGVILISVGLHKGEDGKLHGDYEEEEIDTIASLYTPTPGGVGPVNVAMLLENLVTAAEHLSR